MDESGYRGIRVTSSILVFLPIASVNFPPIPSGYIFIYIGFWLYFTYEHCELYKGVNIFTPNMSILFVTIISCHILLSAIQYFGYLGSGVIIFLTSLISLVWAFSVNIKRSKQIQHKKRIYGPKGPFYRTVMAKKYEH